MHDNLGLSHDDIQRTLQANMPPPDAASHHSKGVQQHQLHNGHQPQHPGHPHPGSAAMPQHPVDLNPMDFIEHDVVNPTAVSGGGHG